MKKTALALTLTLALFVPVYAGAMDQPGITTPSDTTTTTTQTCGAMDQPGVIPPPECRQTSVTESTEEAALVSVVNYLTSLIFG